MKNIIMPKLSDTMTEGLLGSWLKSVGDTIARGDIIAEVETDKATMGLESFDSGVLLEQRVKAGETVPVGTVLGVIGSAGEKPAETAAEAAPVVAVADEAKMAPAAAPEPVATEKVAAAKPVDAAEKTSPVVRRRARELGIDLDNVTGSGPGGRVLLEDLARIKAEPSPREPHAEAVEAAGEDGHPEVQEQQETEARPLSRMRAAIARVVTASWRDIPHFSVTMEVRMGTSGEVLRELKANGTPVSINELIMKGVAVSLLKCPLVNASFIDGNIVLHQEVNLGIMVKVDEGLLVPVIKGCQALSLAEIAERGRQLIQRARSNKISEADMAGGTFSVSNLGAYGVSQFSAIILPPQVAILAVGAVTDRLVPGKGGAVSAKIMKVTLSADHRVLDGVAAAEFLKELKQVLENPVRLLI
jgi:pyruvate dehydrogenase E2 component (dihydrolipoyllysine-residue acetyltransferase)